MPSAFTSARIKALASVFQYVDLDGDAKLTVNELETFLREMYGPEVSHEDALEVFARLDTNRDGVVDVYEFTTASDALVSQLGIDPDAAKSGNIALNALPAEQAEWTEEAASRLAALIMDLAAHLRQRFGQMRETFLRLDQERSGSLNANEFFQIFQQFNLALSKQDVDLIMLRYDLNGDGRVSYEEFCQTLDTAVGYNPAAGNFRLPEIGAPPRRGIMTNNDIPEDEPAPAPDQPFIVDDRRLSSLLKQFAEHLLQRFSTLREAFLRVDDDRSGSLSAEEFFAMFQRYNLPITAEEILLVVQFHDRNGDGRVVYNEFCRTLEKTMAGGVIKFRNFYLSQQNGGQQQPAVSPGAPAGRPSSRQQQSPASRSPAQTEQVIDEKKLTNLLRRFGEHLLQRFSSLREAFLRVDSDRSGSLSANELEEMFKKFNMPIARFEVEALVRIHDFNGDGKVVYNEFCRTLDRAMSGYAIDFSR